MRWFFILSVVLHAFLFVGLALYLRSGSGASGSPFAETLPTSTTHPAMGLLPAPEVKRSGANPRERVEFEIVETLVRPTNAETATPTKAAVRPPAVPKPATGFKLKQVEGYHITIAPSFTGAPVEEKAAKPESAEAGVAVKGPAKEEPVAVPSDVPLPPGFVPAAQVQGED
ncbi:MAG: hypothetical protein KF767_10845 [Bdellovibrionaceae bacterium]|nr:hypothetical protein [Pseudobdellovibrionaceae bacterium]